MAGAFADPVDGALFIFKNVPREEIDALRAQNAELQAIADEGKQIKARAVDQVRIARVVNWTQHHALHRGLVIFPDVNKVLTPT